MIVKVKKLCDNAVIPTYAHSTDAGMDLYATSKFKSSIRIIKGIKNIIYSLFPRCRFVRNVSIDNLGKVYSIGDRIAQGIFSTYLTVDGENTEELQERVGGVGSTGK